MLNTSQVFELLCSIMYSTVQFWSYTRISAGAVVCKRSNEIKRGFLFKIQKLVYGTMADLVHAFFRSLYMKNNTWEQEVAVYDSRWLPIFLGTSLKL